MTWPCCFHAPVWFGGIVTGSHVGMRDRVRWSTLPQTSAPVRTVLGRHAATQVSVSNLRKRGTSSEWRPGSQWSMRANEGQKQKVKLAVMVSGGGRSLENICARIADGQLTGCEIRVVLASKQSAGAIQKAERYGIPAQVLRQCDFDNNTEAFSDAISALLDEYGIDLVVLAGWMHFYLIPQRYEGKVLNIHPSLIPSFCGKGYYGNRVHEAVVSLYESEQLVGVTTRTFIKVTDLFTLFYSLSLTSVVAHSLSSEQRSLVVRSILLTTSTITGPSFCRRPSRSKTQIR